MTLLAVVESLISSLSFGALIFVIDCTSCYGSLI